MADTDSELTLDDLYLLDRMIWSGDELAGAVVKLDIEQTDEHKPAPRDRSKGVMTDDDWNADFTDIDVERGYADDFVGSMTDKIRQRSGTKKAYDPNQPRDPKGSPTGGQWSAHKPPGYSVSNPGGSWLERKQRAAEESMESSPRDKGLSGATTAHAGMDVPMYLPVSELRQLRGRNDEQPRPGNGKYDALERSVRARGYTNENPVFVMVNHKGQAYLNEGNHRVAVASAHNVERVKAWVYWQNGGEEVQGAWSPANVARMASVEKAFNPNQPRRPRGSDRGGEWVGTGGGQRRMRAERNDDGFTLAGYLRRVKQEARDNFSDLSADAWRRDWDGIAEDFWTFGFTPSQALEAIEEREGLIDPIVYKWWNKDRTAYSEKAFDPNQPREPAGRSTGGRWVSNKPAKQGVTDGGKVGGEHMRQYVDMIAKMGAPHFEWMQKHGKVFEIDDQTFIGGKAQQCYKNTFQATMLDEDVTYTEGYMSVHGVPIHHAWGTTKDGKVRDYTIKDPSLVQGYFGTPLQRRFVDRMALKTKVYGALNEMTWHEVLKMDPKDVVEGFDKAFNPNQPRKPKGDPHGGEWTDGSSGGGGKKYPFKSVNQGNRMLDALLDKYHETEDKAERERINTEIARLDRLIGDFEAELYEGQEGILPDDDETVAAHRGPYFHGTVDSVERSILKHGIRPSPRREDAGMYLGGRGKSVYITDAWSVAEDYAQAAAGAAAKDVNPLIFEFKVPKGTELIQDETDSSGYRIKRIPPEWLKAVHRAGPRGGWKRTTIKKDDSTYYAVVMVRERL